MTQSVCKGLLFYYIYNPQLLPLTNMATESGHQMSQMEKSNVNALRIELRKMRFKNLSTMVNFSLFLLEFFF